MLQTSTVRRCTAFFTCLFLVQLSICCAGTTRSSSSIADKLRTLVNIRRTTRNDPYAHYYRPDANELNAVTEEPFIHTTETYIAAEETETESTGFHNPINPWISLDLTDGSHISHSITTESSLFTDLHQVIHSISNDPMPENPSESSSFPLQPTTHLDSMDLPLIYPSVNSTTFPSATYIGIGSLPLMAVIPIVASESPENAVVPGDLQGTNVGAISLDGIQNETTVPHSYTNSEFPVHHPTENSGTSTSMPTIPTKIGSSSGRPFGTSPQPRELGFPPVSNTHENFEIQVNWAEFR